MLSCPRCQHRFGVLESFKILNPLDFPCPGCSARLSADGKGKVSVALGALLGLSLAGASLAGLAAGRLSLLEALLLPFVMLAIVMVPWQWAVVRFTGAKLRPPR